MSVKHLKMEGEYILIEAAPEKEEVRESGVVLKTTAQYADIIKGKIVRISEKCEFPLTVKVGDIAHFVEAGVKDRIKYDDKEFFVITESEIWAYTREEA